MSAELEAAVEPTAASGVEGGDDDRKKSPLERAREVVRQGWWVDGKPRPLRDAADEQALRTAYTAEGAAFIRQLWGGSVPKTDAFPIGMEFNRTMIGYVYGESLWRSHVAEDRSRKLECRVEQLERRLASAETKESADDGAA